jgi:hypothetical protein
VNAGPGDTILVNGISGTLGIGAAPFSGWRCGVNKILGTGRDMQAAAGNQGARALTRIEVFSIDDGSVTDFALQAHGW